MTPPDSLVASSAPETPAFRSTDHSGVSRPLLVLGAGSRPYREDSLRGLAARHQVVLADVELPHWTRPFVRGHLTVDLSDSETALTAVKEFAARTPGLAGVCTYMEHHVLLAARIAEQLGLPGPSPAAMAACRDKAATRRLLAKRDVPSARSVQAADEDAAVEHARLIGYPVVVKPRGMAGSAGVLRADSDSEVRAAFLHAAQETVLGLDAYAEPGVLVEEYLDGEEISAETVVVGDDVRIVAITRKRLGNEPRFQELGHLVDGADPLLGDSAVTETVTRAVRALRIKRGVLHVELRRTGRGPAVVELNGRPGGDLIPVLVHAATGVDLMAAVADLASGTVPDLTPTRARAAAVRFLLPAFSGRVGAVSVPADLRDQPWLERLVWTRHLGERVTAPPLATIEDRLGHWVVTGDTAEECEERLAEVLVRVFAPITGTAVHTTACSR
ncbi:ATP-grasp domain-containing protein [Streptomyces sp. NPDC004237]|uniref:ATP-grasp domain-containing protein n=1 Tax=Streptomyces sp. NPDC004237 TaxID=3154455 RepID=UPI0033B8A70D